MEPTTPLTEAVRRREATHKTLNAARSAYTNAIRSSTFDDPKDDPYVVAAAETLESAGVVYDLAARLVEVEIGAGPIVLSKAETTPQARRALGVWSTSRGSGEVLTEAVARILEALEAGRLVRIEVL
jgi:hypothetical protein